MILSGCFGTDRTPALTDFECALDGRVANGPEVPAIHAGDIYIDLSITMQGFISDESHRMPVTPQQRLLRTILLEGLRKVGVSEPAVWGFGREILPLPAPLARYAESRALYSQGETDVVGVLYTAAENPESLTVILTDNTQDLIEAKPQRAPGFDRVALAQAVSDRLTKDGFGVWLVGFMSSFQGSYYSVLLAANARGTHVNRPMNLTASRPSYCWIISRDIAKGRALVRYLHRELGRLKGGSSESKGTVQAVELAPGLFPEVTVEEPTEVELSAPPAGESGPARGGGAGGATAANSIREGPSDFLQVRDWAINPEGRAGSYGLLAYTTPRGSELLFLLKVKSTPDEEGEGWNSLPHDVWRVRVGEEKALGTQASEDVSAFDLVPEDGYTYRRLAVRYQQLRSRRPEEQRAELPISLDIDLQKLDGDFWLKKWSTDDDREKADIEERTLYLWDVMEDILAETQGRPTQRACLHLVFSKE